VAEARDHPRRREIGARLGDAIEEGDHGCAAHPVRERREKMQDAPIDEPSDPVRVASVREPLERPEPHVRPAEANEDARAGRGRLVAAHQRLTGLEEAERARGRHAEGLEHLAREHLADTALQRQAPVAAARVRCRAAARRAEIEEPAARVAHLREEEASTVAEVRVVHAELVAVVAERERPLEVFSRAA
jgi:hypothetical protein